MFAMFDSSRSRSTSRLGVGRSSLVIPSIPLPECSRFSPSPREYPDRGLALNQVGVVASERVIPIQDLRVTFMASSSVVRFKRGQILHFCPPEINTGQTARDHALILSPLNQL